MRSPRYVQELAKEFRKEPTPAEQRLWEALRRNQMDGVKFHRQRSLGRYVLDFYAPSIKLVIELDGEIHQVDTQKEYDTLRENYLIAQNLRIMRFTNKQILNEIEFCLAEIHKALINERLPIQITVLIPSNIFMGEADVMKRP